MYPIYNPNVMWAHQPMPMQGQVYYGPMPNFHPGAYYVNGNAQPQPQPLAPPNGTAPAHHPMSIGHGHPVYFQPPPVPAPGWLPVSQSQCQRSNGSTSDDDVFFDSPSSSSDRSRFSDAASSGGASSCGASSSARVACPSGKVSKGVQCQTEESCLGVIKKRKKSIAKRRGGTAASVAEGQTKVPECSSSISCGSSLIESNPNSSDSGLSYDCVGHSRMEESSPEKYIQAQTLNMNAINDVPFPSSSNYNEFTHQQMLDNRRQSRFSSDMTLYDVFSASLCSAINQDPPDPSVLLTNPKTSSPIQNGPGNRIASLIDADRLKNAHNHYINSVSSERCLRFSQNGNDVDLTQTMKHDVRVGSQSDFKDPSVVEREEFLKVLDWERERLKRSVLPKFAPKMNCKFCKNNGEPPEVYTKHRLHYNEKTVCPLLRHYVCRLCNSTGDFAHTIRHCPFNTRFDKLAWQATFLC